MLAITDGFDDRQSQNAQMKASVVNRPGVQAIKAVVNIGWRGFADARRTEQLPREGSCLNTAGHPILLMQLLKMGCY
jgi:hypothetical protein